MIEGKRIVCIASSWWYDPTSKHHVMGELAKRNRVAWVNYHGSRRPRVSRADFGAVAGKLRQFIEGPRRVGENITVVTPLVAPWPGNRAVAAMNRRLLVRQIRSVLEGLGDGPVQLWTFAPDVDYLVGRFEEECAVYYCVDAFGEFGGYDREAIEAAERRLMDRVDLVVTTSEALHVEKARQIADIGRDSGASASERGISHERRWGAERGRVVLVRHGVDHGHFARALGNEVEVAEEVRGLRGPVLGFWGLIQDWVDVELIAGAARARPGWTFVLIGETATEVGALGGLGNVRLLGRRSYGALPGYAKGFDAGLVPFRMNGLTRAVNPIKLREYLASGLAVAGTGLPEVERIGGDVFVGDGVEGFVGACERAIAAGRDPAARRARSESVASEGWAARVRELEGHVEAALGRRYTLI